MLPVVARSAFKVVRAYHMFAVPDFGFEYLVFSIFMLYIIMMRKPLRRSI